MKKFILGLLCGLALGGTVAAAAAEPVQAVLFRAIVNFHIHGEDRSIDTGNAPLLNYDNRLYVPLRLFAESMGASVHYHAPADQGSDARVEVAYADDRDLALRDFDEHIGIGHLDVQFRENGEPPFIRGTVKVFKPLPAGQQAVIELYDREGGLRAETEYIAIGDDPHRRIPAADWEAGMTGPFAVHFPYMPPLEEYELKVRLTDESAWRYEQASAEAAVDGAGGLSGYPLAMAIGLDEHEKKPGEPVAIQATILNLGDAAIALKDAASIKVGVSRRDTGEPLWTGSLAPLSGTIPGKKGTLYTQLVWDQRDRDGNAAAPGEYIVYLDLPITVQGVSSEDAPQTRSYRLEASLRTQTPLVIVGEPAPQKGEGLR